MEKPTTKPPVRQLTGVRKRQQIETTNKNIFVWLAVSSIIVSFCIVALQFLVKEFMFNQKVIDTKSKTNQQLIKNVEAGKALTTNINKLLANSSLNSLQKQDPEGKANALSVVLDALPVEGDATGFANSLQTVVLPLSGVSIRELSTSLDQTDGSDTGTAGDAAAQPMTLPFKAAFGGSYAESRKALQDIARVIRPINPTELSIRSDDGGKIQVSMTGVTYYLPARSVHVKTEVLKP